MATNTYYVATGNDDYYYGTDGTVKTTSLLKADYSNISSPSSINEIIADITTSGIGTDTISAATLYWDESSYQASSRVSKTYNIYQVQGSTTVKIATYTFGTAAVRSLVLNSTQLGYINKTGKSRFQIDVDDPGTFKLRILNIKAYETSQANAMRLSVTHAPAATSKPQVINIMES